MRVRNRPTAFDVYFSRANEYERREGYAHQARHIRRTLKRDWKLLNDKARYLMTFCIAVCEREAQS